MSIQQTGKSIFRLIPLVVIALALLIVLQHAAWAGGATSIVYDWGGYTSPTTNGLNAVHCPSTTLCKAVGASGTILSWDGTSWSADISPTMNNLFGVHCPSTTLCKAVGVSTILSWNGTIWSADSHLQPFANVNSVHCPSTTLCKAVGTPDNGVSIQSWNGTSWSGEINAGNMNRVHCPSTTLCKAVGDGGGIRSWNGTSWGTDTSNTTSSLSGVHCPSTTLCKAVAFNSAIRSWNGASWSGDSNSSTDGLNDVHCPSTTLCKAVGGTGTIRSWNATSTSWSGDTSGVSVGFGGVYCPSTSFCFAVGGSGTILRMIVQTLNDVAANFSLDVTQTGCLDGLTITQTNSNHPNAFGTMTDGKYWTVTTSPGGCTTGYSGLMTLSTTFTPNSNSRVCRYTGSGTTWNCAYSSHTSSTVTRTSITQFSDWAASTAAPTAATLIRFGAKYVQAKDAVRVKWATGSELQMVGFNIWKRVKSGKWKLANGELLAAEHTGSVEGARYRYTDTKIKKGKTYFYKLEIVNTDGTSEWSEIDTIQIK